MDLSRRLLSTALVAFIVFLSIQNTQSRFHGQRQKRQYGANMYLPASSVTPGGEGDDPNEWADWSSPSECSRTCGGGVSYQTRECLRRDPNGDAVCSGGDRRYYSCNTQDCPEEEPDFRALQCSRFDDTKFDGVLYEWVPYTNAPNPCELNCMPRGERFYYRQKEKVVDGTRCTDKDLDVCVDGQCLPVGCDMMLGSDAKEDMCRKCGGDGSTCKTIKDTFTTSNLAAGYNDILIIPNGATNIRVQETAPSNNYFACRNLTGHYYLNGNWRIDFPRPMFFANAWWNYQRKPTAFAAPDQLTCSGPIAESIYIVMLVQDKNVSIDYEYSIPESVSQSQPDVHTWTHREFSPCSASCGGGTQSRQVTCNNRINLQEVDNSLCDAQNKPAESQDCGVEPCAPHWVEGEWTKCSKGCGSDGFQNRTVACERISPTGEHTLEDDAVCLKQVGNKPATTQECNRDVKNCPSYHLGPWTPCDKLCGDGKQTRKVTCFIKENGRKRVLPDEDCVEEKPEVEKTCMLAPCEGVDWIISQWSGCEACGQNTETRTAICGSKKGKVYPEEFCEPEVPLLTRPCKSSKCETQWFASEWSKCSSPCGKGVQSRIVICGEFDGKTVSPAADNSKCDASKKPDVEQECEGEEKECPGEWFTGPWDECSKPCGGGERVREVICLSNGTVSTNCEESKVEAISEKCNVDPCSEDEVLPLTSTDKPIEGDDDDEECEDEDDIELVTGGLTDETKVSDGIEIDEESTTLSSLMTDELMLSDAPSDDTTIEDSSASTDATGSTVEGSGDDTDSTSDSSIVTEGSGDDSESTTDVAGTTSSDDTSDQSSASESTDVTSSGATDITSESSESSDKTSDSSDVTEEGTTSSVSDSSDASDSSDSTGETTVSSDVSSGSTEGGSTESGSTETGSTESGSTEGSTEGGSTESTVDVSGSTADVSGSTTDVSGSTEGSTSDVTKATSDSSDSTATTAASDSTESTSDSSTESSSTSEDTTVSTESTSDSSSESSSTSEDTTVSTDNTSDSSTESSTATDVSTESTADASTTNAASSESTTDSVTESTNIGSTQDSSDSTSDGTTDSTVSESSDATSATTDQSEQTSNSDSTDLSSDSTVEGSSDGSTTESGSTVEGSSDGSTTESGSTVDESTDGSSTTDASDKTEITDSTETPGSTESTDASSDGTSSAVSEESTESTTLGASESTETTESGATDESTGSGATDESTSESSTGSSLSTEEGTTEDIWSTSETEGDGETSTPNTWETAITTGRTSKCKPKKKKDCTKSKYGCCPDGKSTPKGPFDKGCPIVKTCADSKHGCCLDGVSPAEGKEYKGCPKSQCAETLFGCCPDKFTPSEGEDNEGCPEPTTLPPPTTTEAPTTELEGSGEGSGLGSAPEILKSCAFDEFGCCPDGKTAAKGNEFQGCDTKPIPEGCDNSEHGCCPDRRTAAAGPNGQGCAPCMQEPFGCCPDNETPAHGPLGEGCCLNSPYGCCPDNINSARGPNFQDCDCAYTPYGCCPDKKTAARGPDNKGCACETTPHGCCPDKINAANGPKFEGCACETMQFGCCPDGLTIAQGPHHYGCHCSQTEHKCCEDGKTPAKGPNFEGCTCVESLHGCCPDGVSSAQDDKFAGCENVQQPPQKSCGLPKDTGTCGNFSVKYYFDTSYGACARFWYGGCDGNANRFETEAECKDTCQDYSGQHMCLLPKSAGPCQGTAKKYYFDVDRNRCEEFTYGGCYGTTNRFDTLEQCQSTCAASENLPPCEQPVESGPCSGNFERWNYDNQTDTCRPFIYGGCKGNKNNYATEHACNYNCRQPGVLKDHCSLPKQTGDCSEQHARWHFSQTDQRCLPFYYTGCGGNKNNFPTLDSCEDHCPRQVAKDICEIPAEVGECTNYTPLWYYDTKDTACRQFYYGGCGGNDNRFTSEESCKARCEKRPEPTTTPQPPPPPPPSRSVDVCAEPESAGDCDQYSLKWRFDQNVGNCRQFYYGGCGGNDNRFETEADCLQRCGRQEQPTPEPQQPTGDICNLPTAAGDCAEWDLQWSYNVTVGKCQQFYYGGCGGNDNRFKAESDCLARCGPSVDTRFGEPEEQRRDENVAQPDTAKCFLPVEAGSCSNNETRWYYNSQEGLCDEFVFSGCEGNENNYASEDDCQNECIEAQTTCSLPPVRGRCNEISRRWFYDERSGSCHEFEFSGCRGNRNNFVTESDCLNFCRGDPQPQQPEPQAPSYTVCDQPPEAGECDNYTTAWFYDNEKLACTAFTYTGCGGNGNRFETRDQCERQCGEFKGIDVCNEPVTTGPCTQWQTRYFYDRETQSCLSFTYGGCDGTGNRFNDRYECETVCIAAREPQVPVASRDICRLPVVIGRCNGPSVSERRWYYDDERGNCVSFIYSGCSGNQNNFRSFEACTNQCGSPLTQNELTNNEIEPSRCESYENECRDLRCPYGVRREAAQSAPECTQCVCENPCEGYPCPEDQQCAIEVSNSGDSQFVPVCRDINKAGECPQLAANASNCARECYTDAHCRGDNKCCSDGCGYLCVRPTRPTQRPPTPAPALIYPGEHKALLESKTQQEVDVQTSMGGIAVLRCFATGSPPPNITWSRKNVVLDTSHGRYVLTSNGDLTIVQVRQTDDGTYVCVASNGLGEPVRREVALQVTEPQEIPAYIYGDKNATQIVQLNQPALVRCPAGGYPAPHVSWWRNNQRFGLVGERYEMTREYSLFFRTIQLSDLGPYTCDVYNSHGRPVSMVITLKAVGPARAVTNQDAQYLQYIIDPATAPATQRPQYPYRPQRPAYVPPPPPPVESEPQRPQATVNAAAVLGRDPRNTYSPGSTILISCSVQGLPTPNVTWTKDSVPLYNDERVQITSEPHRLVVHNVTSDDTGVYGCTARNSFSYSTSEDTINIESAIPVSPECIDNPYFANCKLIVKGQYCFNHYYAKFCCRSCTLAGQIAQPHPNAL